jgi:chemotaxis protein methyltransferase CheR
MNEISHNITTEQIAEIIDLVKVSHGFDFSDYSKASLKRRISRVMMIKKLGVEDLKRLLANDAVFFQFFLEEITVNVTEMFRDPAFYKALSNQVIPHLSAWQRINVWSAGCSSGEEAYSLAILLNNAGLNDSSFIYGTDINTAVLKDARKGVYSQRNLKTYEENYRLCGFAGALTDHFTTSYDTAAIHNHLKANTSFSVHNLIAEAAPNEFQLISCRNVFIYFETPLQEKILDLFYKSLSPNGFLCLGSKETIRSDKFKTRFKPINIKENIYQKIGH